MKRISRGCPTGLVGGEMTLQGERMACKKLGIIWQIIHYGQIIVCGRCGGWNRQAVVEVDDKMAESKSCCRNKFRWA